MSTAHDTRQVVELRIHGVNNASPQSMLDSGPDDVVRVESRSDDSAGFYRVQDAGAGAVREAYWWGGLARLSGRRRALPVLSAVVRAGWVLLLPFGLANVAYWSRPLDNGQLGRGAVSMRLFGLGLTVLLVSTMCTITMDLYALQCWSGGDFCRFDLPLGGLTPASRVALASLLPMAVLAGLWRLTKASRTHYEEYEAKGANGSGAGGATHVLARRELWRGGAMVGGLSCLHVAAGSAVVVIASSWPALIGPGTSCRTLDGLMQPGCMTQRSGLAPEQQVVFGVTAALAALVLAAVVLLVVLRTADAPDVRSAPARWTGQATSGVFVTALALYGAQFVALHAVQPALTAEGTAALPGSNAAPTLEVALLVALAVSGLVWRSRVRYLPEVCGALVGLGLLTTHLWPVAGLVLVAIGCVGVAALRRRGRSEGLRFTAPGVLLGTSLMVAIGFSSVALLGAGFLLTAGASPSSLLRCDPAVGLCAPRVHVWGGTSVLVAGVLTGVLLLVLAALAFARPVPGGPTTSPAVRWACSRAALAHRAEPVVVFLGMLGLVAAAVAVAGTAVPPGSQEFPAGAVEAARLLADSSVVVLALTAVVVMLLVVARSFGSSSTRPLGLVWDLLCVLPRAVHPFAPPCYAERAVPELADRIRELTQKGRLVVLSAHSLGAVLAVAAYFRLDEPERREVRLLTYGAQLRPYFGRLFPDLFGPHVLGTQPCAGARLWSADPWADDRRTTAMPAPGTTTLLGELGTGWLSLWRHTDYLGFPVRSYAKNDTDGVANELGAPGTRVQTHSGYRDTEAYANALARLTGQPTNAVAAPK